MGSLLSCCKSVPPTPEYTKTVPNPSRVVVPTAQVPTWAIGAPSNEATTKGSSAYQQAPGLRANYSASVEVLDSGFDKEKLQPRIDWVIGLDFGTTYSGFAYARMEEDPYIHVYYDWPLKQNERSYCKTVTGLYYKRAGPGRLECASWGYSARSEYTEQRSSQNSQGHYLTKFKLLLKPKCDPTQQRS